MRRSALINPTNLVQAKRQGPIDESKKLIISFEAYFNSNEVIVGWNSLN